MTLTAISLVPPILSGADPATVAALLGLHLVAAAVMVSRPWPGAFAAAPCRLRASRGAPFAGFLRKQRPAEPAETTDNYSTGERARPRRW